MATSSYVSSTVHHSPAAVSQSALASGSPKTIGTEKLLLPLFTYKGGFCRIVGSWQLDVCCLGSVEK